MTASYEAFSRQGILNLSRPIESGFVTDWDDAEALWSHIFNTELSADTREHAVITTEKPFNSNINREKMVYMMFETFGVPGLHLGLQAVLSLFSSGSTTGLVLDSGEDVTHAIPIYEGHAIQHAISRLDLGGGQLTRYLENTLAELGYHFAQAVHGEIVCGIKESLCRAAYNNLSYFPEIEEGYTYQLPDGQVVTLEEERSVWLSAGGVPILTDT